MARSTLSNVDEPENKSNTAAKADFNGRQTSEDDILDSVSSIKAWPHVFATFLIFMSAWYVRSSPRVVNKSQQASTRGLTQTFGAFQEIYLNTVLPKSSPSVISWMGIFQSFLLIILGVFTGPLFDAGYLRILLVAGCGLIFVGLVLLSPATAYWHVFLAQGIAVGIGSGLVYVPSLSLVALSFPPSKRPWAIGCANAGGSIGGIAFTYMLRGLMPIMGFAWTVRVVALINLVLAVVALGFILSQYPLRQHERRALIDIEAFKDRHFILFGVGLLFNYVGFYIPAFYTPIFATAKLGKSREFGFDCLNLIVPPQSQCAYFTMNCSVGCSNCQ